MQTAQISIQDCIEVTDTNLFYNYDCIIMVCSKMKQYSPLPLNVKIKSQKSQKFDVASLVMKSVMLLDKGIEIQHRLYSLQHKKQRCISFLPLQLPVVMLELGTTVIM